MNTQWLKGCQTKAAKEQREKELQLSKLGFQHLRAVVQTNYDAAVKARVQPDYDSPSWGFKQADLNATERELKKILDLLDDVC